MLVLGIESTCDETSAAIVRSGKTILSHIIASQAHIHEEFGGVVPELASRHHSNDIFYVLDACIRKAALSLDDIDLIAVAKGPGLIGSLLVGIQTAKAMAWSLKKPLVGVNHIEAHLYASIMGCDNPDEFFPALGMILSGGHSTLVLIEAIGKYRLIGQTVDDALGEAFDKVAKMLGLGYPGGPIVEKLSLEGNPKKYPFRAGRVKGQQYSFSFSGLKTAVLYTINAIKELNTTTIADICSSFQHAAFNDLISKLQSACKDFHPKALFFGGGVTQNRTLRSILQKEISIPLFWPAPELCLDNGAMIAGLGFHVWQKSFFNECFTLEPCTRIEIYI